MSDRPLVAQDHLILMRLAGGPGRTRIGIVTAAAPVRAEDPTPALRTATTATATPAFTGPAGRDAQWIPIDLDHPGAAGDRYRYVTTMTPQPGRPLRYVTEFRNPASYPG